MRADVESIRKVESESDELVKKLSDMERLKIRMRSKHELLVRVQQLRNRVADREKDELTVKEEETQAEESLQLAEQKKKATLDDREQIADERKSIEKMLDDLKSEKSNFETQYSKMLDDKKRTDALEIELEKEKERLLRTVEVVVHKFKDNGWHTWLERNLDTFPAIIKETVLKTSKALDPVVDSVGEVSQFNDLLTNETTQAITRYVPAIKDSPFYTGLIFYIILLFPLVSAIWLVMKVRARLSLLTVEHYLVAINLYFGVLSLVCAVMTILSKTDILIVFRHRSLHLAESFTILHGLLFIIHLILHGMTAYVSGARKDFAQYTCMSCVGLHFFMNAYKRTILNQDPHIGAPAYVVYTSIFLYILYDRGVHILEAAVKDRKADTSAFGTYLHDQASCNLPTTVSSKNDTGDRTVYFAGLPVFNAPSQSSLNDAKTI